MDHPLIIMPLFKTHPLISSKGLTINTHLVDVYVYVYVHVFRSSVHRKIISLRPGRVLQTVRGSTTSLRSCGGATPSGGGATPGWPSPAATRPGRETRRASHQQRRRRAPPPTARAPGRRRRTGGSRWRPPSPSCTPRWPCTPTVSGLPLQRTGRPADRWPGQHLAC